MLKIRLWKAKKHECEQKTNSRLTRIFQTLFSCNIHTIICTFGVAFGVREIQCDQPKSVNHVTVESFSQPRRNHYSDVITTFRTTHTFIPAHC